MAFIYCRSCKWSQDDFWSRSYNPVKTLWTSIKRNIRPRWINMDLWFMKDYKYPYRLRIEQTKAEIEKIYSGCAFTVQARPEIHSWYSLWREIKQAVKAPFKQKWWFSSSWNWQKKCPQCGECSWSVD